ncbi:hypothetical protein ACWDG1_47690 [Streptomyces sp. NPDC001177]
MALVEYGTRALIGATFGPDTTRELGYARRLPDQLDASMVLLADAYYNAFDFPPRGDRHRRILPDALDSQAAPHHAPTAAERLLPDHHLRREVPVGTWLRQAPCPHRRGLDNRHAGRGAPAAPSCGG